MSIWQVHAQQTSKWSSTSRLYVPEENDKIFKGLPNVSGIVDGILVVGYDI